LVGPGGGRHRRRAHLAGVARVDAPGGIKNATDVTGKCAARAGADVPGAAARAIRRRGAGAGAGGTLVARRTRVAVVARRTVDLVGPGGGRRGRRADLAGVARVDRARGVERAADVTVRGAG